MARSGRKVCAVFLFYVNRELFTDLKCIFFRLSYLFSSMRTRPISLTTHHLDGIDDGGGPRIRIANARSKLWKEVEGLLQFVEVVRIQERT